MALTPVEIRHMTPGTGLFGYKRAAMDRLLDEIASSFEDVWRERADLADKIEQRETDLILGEAHAEARAVQRQARTENERLVADSRRLKAQLRAALEGIEDVEDSWPDTEAVAETKAE